MMLLPGCATLQQYAAVQNVGWSLEGVSSVRIADIDVSSAVTSYSDLGLLHLTQLMDAVSRGELPLELVAHVGAHNPASNSVAAKLMDLQWSLFIEDRKTVGGRLGNTYTIPAGQSIDVPVAVQLDLLEFFEGNAQQIFDLALTVAGHSSNTTELRLELIPTIDTALGPMSYPAPVVVRRTLGGER